MIRVLVADDQQLIRSGFAMMISSTDDLEVVSEVGDGRTAVEETRRLRPDVVLMDIRMPDMNGIDATSQIAADPTLDGTHVLILTTFDLDEYVYDALRAGASGFLLKDTDPHELLAAIRVVAGGEALLAPTVTKRLIEDIAKRPGRRRDLDAERFESLTERELEIVRLVARGLSNDEIAAEAFISPATAKTHVSRAMIKIGARDRAQMVALAYESGIADTH